MPEFLTSSHIILTVKSLLFQHKKWTKIIWRWHLKSNKVNGQEVKNEKVRRNPKEKWIKHELRKVVNRDIKSIKWQVLSFYHMLKEGSVLEYDFWTIFGNLGVREPQWRSGFSKMWGVFRSNPYHILSSRLLLRKGLTGYSCKSDMSSHIFKWRVTWFSEW